MLISEAGGEPVVGEFRETFDGLAAEFKNLPKADYMIVVEGRKAKKRYRQSRGPANGNDQKKL